MDSCFKQKPLWLYAVKGGAVAGLILLVKLLMTLFTFLYYTGNASFDNGDMYLVYIIIFVASLVIYNSVVGLFQTFDPPSAAEYFEKRDGLRTKFAKIYAYPSFLMEYGTATVILSVSAALGLFPEVAGMFYTGEGLSPYSAGLLPFGVSLLLFTLCYLWRRHEAVLYWRELEKKERLFDLGGNRTVAIRFLFILLFYPTVLPGFPLVFMIPSTLFALFFATSAKISPLGTVLVTVGVVLFIVLIRILLLLLRRKRFLRRLRSTAALAGYEISKIQNPYKSLFTRGVACRLDLKFKGIIYNCLLIGCRHPGVPICFSSSREGYFRYRLGTKNHHITLSFTFNYEIDGDGIKILILEPTPKRALVCEGEREKVLFNADKLWDCVVYEADAFIGTMERYCLGKADAYRG